jgi:alkyldihydroxyacetonephosphate synthase
MPELKWYGWGDASKTYPLDHRPNAWKFLRAELELRGDEQFPVCDLATIQLRVPRIDENTLMKALETDLRSRSTLAQVFIRTDKLARLMHTYGRSYRDLVRLRRGEISNPPDAVVYPTTETQVLRLVQFCAEKNMALIPFGGGSSVVGGVEPRDERITISLDMSKLNQFIALDTVSQTATFQAGILGPDLEHVLNERKFALGHLPQSFEYSTLGGWIATRGAGLSSTKYGKIENMTVSVRVATPNGMVDTRTVPATAAGPSLLQFLIGSEGTLGVITQATMRVHPLPRAPSYHALLFKNFASGVSAIREMMQSDLVPATVRLSDEDETRSFFSLRGESPLLIESAQSIYLRVLDTFGYSFAHGALMILGFEGDVDRVNADKSRGFKICKAHGALDLGETVAHTWLRDRYETPYLRDVLMDHGVLVDTLETATMWEHLERLHKALRETIRQSTEKTGARALVMTHVSHCYPDGASLYVTFLARMNRGDEIEQWQVIKRAATDCIMQNGGTLTHHHGVGYEHAAWMKDEIGEQGIDWLRAVKQSVDPKNILNPGKILQ